jgi:membrane protease YdiL (CAAX protease family)
MTRPPPAWVLWLVAVGAVVAKAAQLRWLPGVGANALRQGVLLGLTTLLVWCLMRRAEGGARAPAGTRPGGLGEVLVALGWPVRKLSSATSDEHVAVVCGFFSVYFAVVGVFELGRGERGATPWVAIGLSGLLLGGMLLFEWMARQSHRAGVGPMPTGVASWSTLPALTVAAVYVLIALPSAATGHAGLGKVVEIVVVTALGEELLFRGLLLSLAFWRSPSLKSFLVPSLAFGFWHVVDAYRDAAAASWPWPADVLFVAGTVVLMTVVSAAVLCPLRLRSGSVLGPVLLHATVNLCGAFLGLSTTGG